MQSLVEAHFEQYCKRHGYDPACPVQAFVDSELSVRYPVLLRKRPGNLIISLTKELQDAVEPLETLPPESTLEEVMAFLFDEGIIYETDISHVAVLEQVGPAPLPSERFETRRLTNADKRLLTQFNKALSKQERALSQLCLKDETVIGAFLQERLVAAASALRWNRIVDLSVASHPEFRGIGAGTAAVLAVCREYWHKDAILQYRCDQHNAASVNLMRTAGFLPVLELQGAMMRLDQMR